MILEDRIARLSANGTLAKLSRGGARKRAHDGSSSSAAACFLYPGQTCKPKGAPLQPQPPPVAMHIGDIPGRYIHKSQAAAAAVASSAQELLSRLTPSPVMVASSPSPTSSVLSSSPVYATVQGPNSI